MRRFDHGQCVGRSARTIIAESSNRAQFTRDRLCDKQKLAFVKPQIDTDRLKVGQADKRTVQQHTIERELTALVEQSAQLITQREAFGLDRARAVGFDQHVAEHLVSYAEGHRKSDRSRTLDDRTGPCLVLCKCRRSYRHADQCEHGHGHGRGPQLAALGAVHPGNSIKVAVRRATILRRATCSTAAGTCDSGRERRRLHQSA